MENICNYGLQASASKFENNKSLILTGKVLITKLTKYIEIYHIKNYPIVSD